jgi:hypothetical protein
MLLLGMAFAQQYRAPFGDADYSSFYPTAYYDHSGKDWACGSIRYSGHRGSDFGVGSWAGMDAGRDIVAAADGTVVARNDGEFDRCESGECGGGGGYGNYLAIRHSDGKTTYYAHMKKWTVAKNVNDTVKCGDFLGEVGSSGYSTGPHVHFEARTSGNVAVDPFDGSCSSPPSYWTSQGSHGNRPGKTCEIKDADGDGWNDDEDCAPSDKNVHPGATEICDDGIDNDCTGGDATSRIYYRDNDGDGYGFSEVLVCGTPPGDVVGNGDDCDDTRPTVNPGAEELCDGLDNDCDGLIDDGPPTVMGDPPPQQAAWLHDFSHPGVLAPGRTDEVWFVFENVGSVPWLAGEVWLSADAVSPLQDERTWPAWNVLATLEEDVQPGEEGLFLGRVRAPETRGPVQTTFSLVSPSGPLRCPGGEVTIALTVRDGADSNEESTEGATGCSTSPPWSPLALLGLLLLRRRP